MATGGGGGGGGGVRRGRRAGIPGLCWKTCYFPILFWVVSVCGEEKTLIVEVGRQNVGAHLHPNIQDTGRARHVFVCVFYLHPSGPWMFRNEHPGPSTPAARWSARRSCAPRCVLTPLLALSFCDRSDRHPSRKGVGVEGWRTKIFTS